MSRSVRLYTATQFEEVKTLVDLMAERSDLPPAERDRLTAFQADLRQTVREDRRDPAPRVRELTRVMTAEPAAATRHAATYPGRVDQLHHVRRAVGSHLAGCAAAADAVLVASELAANAILHSRSRAGTSPSVPSCTQTMSGSTPKTSADRGAAGNPTAARTAWT
jgi:hypothetical protein